MTDPLPDLLTSLDLDSTRAAEHYEELRARLIERFRARGLSDAEHLADETFDRVARRLRESEQPRDLARYIFGTGRLVALEASRRARRSQPLDDEAAFDAPLPPRDCEARIEALSVCLAELPAPTRELLLRYEHGHRGERIAHRRALALELGIGINALRIRVHRLREKLFVRVGELGAR
jgi:DNA-directed RNA polymerase specialized sigma24 family protein